MSIIIEKATLQHMAALETLARATFTATFGHLYAHNNLQAHLNKTCSATFFVQELANGCNIDIARIGNDLIGYVKYGSVNLPVKHDSKDMEIHRLYVAGKQQGQGIGKKLMENALNSPALQAASNIFLGVWENNHKAQAFYRSYGFNPIGEYLYYVGDHADREIIMRCRVSATL